MNQFQNNKFFYDERFGEYQIVEFPNQFNEPLIAKLERFNSIEHFNVRKKQIEQRSQFNCESILQLQLFEFDEKNLRAIVYFDFYPYSIDLEYINKLDSIFLFKDILQSILYLASKKMIHGDIRPEFISFNEKNQKFVLIDRLNDTQPPLQLQIDHIQNEDNIYMSPKIYNSLINSQTKIKQHAFKSELFSLGLVCLSAFGVQQEIQELYSFEDKVFKFDQLAHIFSKLGKNIFNTQIQEFLIFLQNYVLVREDLRISPRKVYEKIQNFKHLNVYFNITDDTEDSKDNYQMHKKSQTNIQDLTFKTSLNSTQTDIHHYNNYQSYQSPINEILESNSKQNFNDEINSDIQNKIKLKENLYIDVEAQDFIVVDQDSNEKIQNFKKIIQNKNYKKNKPDLIRRMNFLKINFQPQQKDSLNFINFKNKEFFNPKIFCQKIFYENKTIPLDFLNQDDSLVKSTPSSSVKTFKKKKTFQQNKSQDFKIFLSSIGVEFGEQEKQDQFNLQRDQKVLMEESAFLKNSTELLRKKNNQNNLLTPKKEKLKHYLLRKSISRSSNTEKEEMSNKDSIDKKNFILYKQQRFEIEDPLQYSQVPQQRRNSQTKLFIQDSSIPQQLQYKSDRANIYNQSPFQCQYDVLEDFNPRLTIKNEPLPNQQPQQVDKGKLDVPMDLLLNDIFLKIKLKNINIYQDKRIFQLDLTKVCNNQKDLNNTFSSKQSLECQEYKKNKSIISRDQLKNKQQFYYTQNFNRLKNQNKKTPSKEIDLRNYSKRKLNFSKSKSRKKTLQKKNYFTKTFHEIKQKHKLNKNKNHTGQQELEDLKMKIQANILESKRLQQQLELMSSNSIKKDMQQYNQYAGDIKIKQKFWNKLDLNENQQSSDFDNQCFSSRQYRDFEDRSQYRQKQSQEHNRFHRMNVNEQRGFNTARESVNELNKDNLSNLSSQSRRSRFDLKKFKNHFKFQFTFNYKMVIKILYTLFLLQFDVLSINKNDVKIVYYTVVLKDISLTAENKQTIWLGSHSLNDNRILDVKQIKRRILNFGQQQKNRFDEISYVTQNKKTQVNNFDEKSAVTNFGVNQRQSVTGTLQGNSFKITNISVSQLQSSSIVEQQYDQRSCQFKNDFLYENDITIIEHMVDPENEFLKQVIKNVPTLQEQNNMSSSQKMDVLIAQDLNKKIDINLAQNSKIDFVESKSQNMIEIDIEENNFEPHENINFTLYQEMTIELKNGKRISKWDGVPVSIKIVHKPTLGKTNI